MKPLLSCLQPGWKPAGQLATIWEPTPFPDTPGALEHPEHERPRMWAAESMWTIVSIDPWRLTMSFWGHERDDEDFMSHHRRRVRIVFICDERPTWIWRKGGDVALQRWEHEQRARDAAGDQSAFRKPDPVYAWHYTDKDEVLL